MVRAIVEEGVPWIDSFLVYERIDDSSRLQRIPVHDGQFQRAGRTNVLLWSDAQGHGIPVNGRMLGSATFDRTAGVLMLRASHDPPLDVPIKVLDSTEFTSGFSRNDLGTGKTVVVECELDTSGNIVAKKIAPSNTAEGPNVNFVDLAHVGASGDVAFSKGHFHPNKAPGTSFAAVPAYFLIYHVEHLFGINPDDWWILTLNAWLTSIMSVGLISALGVVIFHRLANDLFRGQSLAAGVTALAFAFGTMFFPYATMLYEHNIIMVGLIAALYVLQRCRTCEGGGQLNSSHIRRKNWSDLYLGGLCAGYAAVTNYIIAIIVVFFFFYVVLAVRKKNGWLWFGIGLSGPLLALCLYHTICFGSPFTTNYGHQNPQFTETGRTLLGIFVVPRWDVLLALLFSPFRGLFFSAPVLLLGVFGLVRLFRFFPRARAEGWLILAIVLFLLLFNISFNGWTGGWTTVPRYLAPAVPFLALPIVLAAQRFFKITTLLALLSGTIMLLTTAVDPQSPLGNALTLPETPSWRYNPLTQYEVPLFLTGHSSVLANTPFMAITGPVSANITGVYEGRIGQIFPVPSLQTRWNSFNVGEFLWPESRWSLFPLLIVGACLCGFALRTARQIDTGIILARSSAQP